MTKHELLNAISLKQSIKGKDLNDIASNLKEFNLNTMLQHLYRLSKQGLIDYIKAKPQFPPKHAVFKITKKGLNRLDWFEKKKCKNKDCQICY